MKTKLFTVVALATAMFAFAQTKSTGTVTIGSMTVKIDLDSSTSTATYTLTGPSTKWFAIGLNATSMSTNTPIDVAQYGTSLLDRYLAGGHSAPTTDSTNNLTLVSDNVSGSTRTVVATRPFSTGDNKDYTFNYNTISTLNIIWAVGPNTSVGNQHSTMGSKSLTFTTVAGVADVAKLENLVVYPVPTANTLNIENKAGILVENVKIFDINARLVKEVKPTVTETINVDVSSLENGTYFVEISGNGDQTVKKIEVKH